MASLVILGGLRAGQDFEILSILIFLMLVMFVLERAIKITPKVIAKLKLIFHS